MPRAWRIRAEDDLIAKFLLGLFKQAQRLIDSLLPIPGVGLSNSDLDALGKPLVAPFRACRSCGLIPLREQQFSPEDNGLDGSRFCFGHLIDQLRDFIPVAPRLRPTLIILGQKPSQHRTKPRHLLREIAIFLDRPSNVSLALKVLIQPSSADRSFGLALGPGDKHFAASPAPPTLYNTE